LENSLRQIFPNFYCDYEKVKLDSSKYNLSESFQALFLLKNTNVEPNIV